MKFGEEINIHGKDILLDKDSNYISMTTYDSNGTRCYYSTIMADREGLCPYDAELLYNSDEFLRVAWPKSWTIDKVVGQTIRFHFLDCSGKGSHDSFSHPVTILK